MKKRGIAIVVVGYPATPIISSRVRFCLSAAHSKEDLDYVLHCISDIGNDMDMKVSTERPARDFVFENAQSYADKHLGLSLIHI